MKNNIFDSWQQPKSIYSTNNSTLPLMIPLQSEPWSRVKLFKTFSVYIIILCPENASNNTVTGLNWIPGTDKMDTYRTPARFPVFEWVLYQEHTFTDKRQNTRNQRQNLFLPLEILNGGEILVTCKFKFPKACCPTHSLLSVWNSAVGKFWIVAETLQWCNAQVGTVSGVATMYACGSCIRAELSHHTSRYWARQRLQPHWLSRGAQWPGETPISPSQSCWVCIPCSLVQFAAWTPSYCCHKAQSWQCIAVFQSCVVEPLWFLQSVCVFRTLAAGTLQNSRAGLSMRWLSSMCRRTTSQLLVYQYSFMRVHILKRSAPCHCALQMCSITRNFAHQTSM